MSNSPTITYHAIGGKPQAGVHMVMPAFPATWLRAFNIYESSWSADVAGVYTVDELALRRYLDFVAYPTQNASQSPDTHSGGACEANFNGPIIVDMERYRPRQKPAAFQRVLSLVKQWRPSARVGLYDSISKWASQWDTPATAETKMQENSDDNAAVYTFDKHVSLYLKDATAAATWERWNEKNCAECERMQARTGGRGYAWVCPSDWNGSAIVDVNRMLAQVRPAIRVGMDIIVWDYWFTNAERDADVAGLALLNTAIETAKADLWRE